MKLKTYKMDAALYNKLKKIDTNVDEAIRVLLKALYAESMVVWNEEVIKKWGEQIEANEKEIHDIPILKEEAKTKAKQDLIDKIDNLKFQRKVALIKQAHPKILIATREFETLPEWEEIQTEDYKQGIAEMDKQIENTENTLSKVDELYDKSTIYEEKLELLKKQNERIEMDIDKAKRTIEVQKLLDLKQVDEADYIG